MASSFGGTVKLTGESEYRKALRDITTNLKEVSSELKLTNAQFTSGDKTVKDTKIAYNNMNTTMQEQKSKITELKTLISQMTKEYNEHQNKLVQVEEQYGKNSKEASEYRTKLGNTENQLKTFKTQLNNAETQLVQMENATGKSNKELKEMKNGFDDAGQGAIKFGDLLKANVLGDFITSGLKAVVGAAKQVGSTLLNVGKEALDSYANYEQFVGGVETLFKDNANTVEQYANNAYKTAGLSANDYMETITSFSASLLQSLNGDTAKVAEVGNMAVTDMADNANKMGIDMSLIQNAYQGFAKQNYTMLDNLKLGYGGTKEEMQRLLSDAQKITGVKYDISNLNDVYQAIHVVQGELGITGTTAKEASTTIQGSASAMKSAWQNMLTGIATGDTGNVENLVNNLVDSVMTASQNILPRVNEIAKGITAVLPDIIVEINNNLPTLLDSGVQILNTLLEGIVSNLPAIMSGANQIIEKLTSTLIEMLPQLIDVGIQVITSLAEGLGQQLPVLIPKMVDTVITIVNSLLDNIDMVIDAGIQLILGLAEGLINALPNLIEKAPEIIQKLFDALVRSFPKIVQAGGRLISELVSGIIGSAFKLLEVAPKLISNMVNGFKQGLNEIKNVGKYLVEGLWDGITGMASWVGDKVKSFASNIVGNIKDALGIHSPSAILRDQVGKFMAQGIGVGFSDEMINVSKNMQNSIPTEFDVNSTIKTNESSNKLSLESITGAFITAVKNLDAQIIIDKDVAGRFVITSVNDRLGEVL